MRVGGLASRAGCWDVRLARIGPGNVRRCSACVGTRGGGVDRSRRWRRRHNARTPPPRARATAALASRQHAHTRPRACRPSALSCASRSAGSEGICRTASFIVVARHISSIGRGNLSASILCIFKLACPLLRSSTRPQPLHPRRGERRVWLDTGNASFAFAAESPAAAPPAAPRAAGGPLDAGVGVGAATNAVRLLPRAGAAAAFAPPTARARVAKRAQARSAIEHVLLGEQQGNQSGLQSRRRPGMSVGVAARAFAVDKAMLDWQWQRIPGMGQPATSRPWGGCRKRPNATSYVIHSVAECFPLYRPYLHRITSRVSYELSVGRERPTFNP